MTFVANVEKPKPFWVLAIQDIPISAKSTKNPEKYDEKNIKTFIIQSNWYSNLLYMDIGDIPTVIDTFTHH